MEMSEITEENDEDNPSIINDKALKKRLRRIIAYQKSLYFSSSSPSSLSSSASSCSSFSSSRTSSSLTDLRKGGNTSLKRLFDMEHTSLSTYSGLRCFPNHKDHTSVGVNLLQVGVSREANEEEEEKEIDQKKVIQKIARIY
ncbi:hypothetical protein SLE2022_074280 [Rubroshorea leprosula]